MSLLRLSQALFFHTRSLPPRNLWKNLQCNGHLEGLDVLSGRKPGKSSSQYTRTTPDSRRRRKIRRIAIDQCNARNHSARPKMNYPKEICTVAERVIWFESAEESLRYPKWFLA